MLIKDVRVKSLLDKYKTIYSLKSLLMLSNWDIETYMPKAGIEARGVVTSKVESLIQQLSLDPEYIMDLKEVKEINGMSELTDSEKSILWHLWHSYKKYQKLPKEFLEEYSALTATSSTVWAEARKENDFKKFAPYLKKIFSMTRKLTDYLGYNYHPYEALIEDYEPGLTIMDYEIYFKNLKDVLSQFDFKKAPQIDLLPEEFSVDRLKDICEKILFLLNVDFTSLRLDESAHPFTNSIAKNDARITTNYNKSSPLSAVYSTIHEFGHALFGMQSSKELEFTPIFEGISYGIHESQSRYWENIIGRSKEFINWLAPLMQTLGKGYENITANKVYENANQVRPSLIRIEADELTYHYHILIRYELEKALLEGSLTVDEAPDAWAEKYNEYLGIKPKTFSDGIMQDIHWSLGLIGYFPSYSMGTVLASSIDEKIGDKLTNGIDAKIIKSIQEWLKQNIHDYAGTYNYKELSSKLTGKEINLAPWEKYMKSKFKNLLK